MKQLKKLDLATYEVEELNQKELLDSEGGFWYEFINDCFTSVFGYTIGCVAVGSCASLGYAMYNGSAMSSNPYYCPLR